jgi:hypothetical protein
MEVFTLPGSLSDPKLKLLEAAFQGFPLPSFSARGSLLLGKLAQVFPNEARQGGVTVDGYFANPLYQFIGQRKRDIHSPIIRETLNMGKR